MFEPVVILQRLALALAVGLFVGLEREHNRKEAGLRTFSFVSVLGALGGILGDPYGVMAIIVVAVLVLLLNVQTIRTEEGAELTTSAALLVTVFTGLLAGKGQTIPPTALAVMTAALLAWKKPLAGFSRALSEIEVRSAILLGVLAFVVYPVLPVGSVDPWGLIVPRTAWITVILIAALGFVNYVLLKLFKDRGVLLTGFLGGLVNSKVTTIELTTRAQQMGDRLSDAAYRGIVLANGSMVLRNVVILGILAPTAILVMPAPFLLMMGGAAAIAFRPNIPSRFIQRWIPSIITNITHDSESEQSLADLHSPFSVSAAIKFGVMFLIIQVVSTIAMRELGAFGLYAVALIGGVVSSVGAVASIANLAERGEITPQIAALSVVMTSISSLLFCIPFVARGGWKTPLSRRVAWTIGGLAGLGIVSAVAHVLIFGV